MVTFYSSIIFFFAKCHLTQKRMSPHCHRQNSRHTVSEQLQVPLAEARSAEVDLGPCAIRAVVDEHVFPSLSCARALPRTCVPVCCHAHSGGATHAEFESPNSRRARKRGTVPLHNTDHTTCLGLLFFCKKRGGVELATY